MKIDIKTIISKILPILAIIKRYTVFLLVILILFIAAFFVIRINQYSRIEPSDDAMTDRLKSVGRPKVDQKTLDRIDELQSQNVQIQSLFNDTRNNPFSE